MRVRVLLKFAKILMLSRLRNTRRSFLSNSITNRPILIALIASIMFVAGAGFGTATVSFLRGAGASPMDIGQIVETIFGGIPIFLIGFFFTMGLLWALNASSESAIINSVSSANAATILVPLLWPTLSITSLLRSNRLSSAFFLLLSLGFLALLSSTALVLRSRFWVATPPSFHFSNTGTISGVSRLRKIGVSAISLALVRREIRSATRRKEGVRLMAIPIILPVMISFPAIFSPAPTNGAPSGLISPLFLAVPLLFGVGLGTLFLGMTSIGQEGKRLWNLSSLPIEAGTIVTSKVLFTSLISTIGLVLGLGLTVFFFQVSVLDALTFIAVGITLVLAEASLGVAIGSRYPDFSDGPRPRVVTIIGSLIGAFP